MRQILTALVLLTSAFGQDTKRDILTAYLDNAVDALRNNPQARGVRSYAMPEFRAVLAQPGQMTMNAQALKGVYVIEVSPELVEATKNAPGELAFVVAHEIGHLQDQGCAPSTQAQKRICEMRADEIGLQYLLAAGFSPFDGAGLMGRLLMYSGTETSVTGIMLNRFVSDHPVDVDRIKHLRDFTRTICQQRPEVCSR